MNSSRNPAMFEVEVARGELDTWEDDSGSLGYEEELMAKDFSYKVEG